MTKKYKRIYFKDGHPLIRETSSTVSEHRSVYYDRYGMGPFKCHWCSKDVNWTTLHIDHINNNSLDNRIENLVASCSVCNMTRSVAHDEDAMYISEKKATEKQLKNKEIAISGRRGGAPKKIIEFGGKSMGIGEWARHLGIDPTALRTRLKKWPLEDALTLPKIAAYDVKAKKKSDKVLDCKNLAFMIHYTLRPESKVFLRSLLK